MKRRNFIINMTMGGAATLLTPMVIAIPNDAAANWQSGGGITPFLIFEDCVKLLLEVPLLKQTFKDALTGDVHKPLVGNLARLAGALPNGKTHIINMLEKLRNAGAKTDIKFYDEKMSFVLGWILLKSSTKNINEFNARLFKANQDVNEAISFQDAFLIKERFGTSNNNSFARDKTSSLFLGILARAVTRIHTLTPDKTDGRKWIIRTTDWRVRNKEYMDLLGEIMKNPDQKKKNLYWEKPIYFDPKDPLIAGNFKYEALNTKNRSLYANSIKNGFKAILVAQDYFEGKTSLEAVAKFV